MTGPEAGGDTTLEPSENGAAETLRSLQAQGDPVFAIYDAARDKRILELLAEGGEPSRCLYKGETALQLAEYAPYIVAFSDGSPLLATMIREGWGRAWGIYFTSRASLTELWRHFRKFTMAELPDGKLVYFRFYDPRVLRIFLPTCDDAQYASFSAPIRSWWTEGFCESALLRGGMH